MPGPLTCDQETERTPNGLPSSAALPSSDAADTGQGTSRSGPASTTGGKFERPVASTSTVVVSPTVIDCAGKVAESLSTYMPGWENRAIVSVAAASSNVTLPGPETALQAISITSPRAPWTVPFSAAAGAMTVCEGPAETNGLASAASTVTRISRVPWSSPSLAESRSRYSPGALNVAVVESSVASAKETVPEPATLLQLVVSVDPAGRPSSDTLPASCAADGR